MNWASACVGSGKSGAETMRTQANSDEKSIGDDSDEESNFIPDGGVNLAAIECPRCLFGEGKADLGANVCSECGSWFHVDQRGQAVATSGPGRPIATDGGHGNYYGVDGERDGNAEDDLEDQDGRRATIERSEDGGYLITDGGVVIEMPDLVPSEESLLELLYSTGDGTRGDLKERFEEQTEFAADTASNCLSTLQKHNLVERRANLRNPSANIWSITPDGEYFVEAEIFKVGETAVDAGSQGGTFDGDD